MGERGRSRKEAEGGSVVGVEKGHYVAPLPNSGGPAFPPPLTIPKIAHSHILAVVSLASAVIAWPC